jgi:dihydropteroate synthase
MKISRLPILDAVVSRSRTPRENRPNTFQRPKFIFRCRDYHLALGEQTKMMGIVNVTPDSFSGDGCLSQPKYHLHKTIKLAQKFIAEGAHLLDIGGESTRPGAAPVSIKEEIKRVVPVIAALSNSPIPISIDTYKPQVALEALAAGASIVNNIMGVKANKSLLKAVQRYNAGIVLMHIRGTPRTMQKNIHYDRIIDDIIASLRRSLEICLEMGIKSDRIILDPGIGFGKTPEQNLEIINRLNEFQQLNRPILIGTSRKSFIGRILDQEVNDRLIGTAATVAASILRGAHIVRVHDVKAMAQTARVTDAIVNQRIA